MDAEEQRWQQVDAWLGQLIDEDEALVAARTNERVTRPGIEVTPLAGGLLGLLARAIGARRVLEFGTLAGYSTIWLARAVGEQGRVVSLELDQRNAAEARANLERAGVSAWVDIWCGPAAQVSTRMVEGGVQPFDLAFVDADKANLPTYLENAIRLTRPGGLIVLDIVVRGGRVLDEKSDDEDVRGVQQAITAASRDPRVEGTALQTVGAKGWDGLAILRRVD